MPKQVNKFIIKWSVLMTSIVVLIVLSIIYLSIYKNNVVEDNYTLQTDTLFYTGRNSPDDRVLYLLMEYKIFNKDSMYVKRSLILEKDEKRFRYFIVKRNDSLVLVKPIKKDEPDSDSIYIDLRKGKIGHVDYFLNNLASDLQFVGYEKYKDRNGKLDSLIVMYGCDINSIGCFEENNKLCWYFDKNFHLRKAAGKNGFLFFIDKHFFGIEKLDTLPDLDHSIRIL